MSGRAGAWGSFFLRLIFLISLCVTEVWASAPQWIEVRTPHFILFTNASESQAKKTAHQFELIRAVFSRPFGKAEASDEPLRIIAVKDENGLRTLLPEFYEKKNSATRAGVFLGGTDTEYIALRSDLSLDRDAFEPFEPIYHEYVHYLTRRLISKMPLWMTEGLAEFFANVRLETKAVYLGTPSDSNLIELHNHQLLPVEQLFAIDSSSPFYNEQYKSSIFYAESWALVHYLYARDWKDNGDRFSQFLNLLSHGTDQNAAAAQTIGDPKSLNEPLAKYVQQRAFVAAKFEAPHVDDDKFQLRSMSDAEAESVRADFMARDQHFEAAQQMCLDAIRADPKVPLAYETLAYIALQKRNAADVEKWAGQAVALDPNAGRANFYYASSLLMKGATPDPETLAKAETSLRATIKAEPNFTPAYEAMAYTLLSMGTPEKAEEAYLMILQAIQREPGNIQYRLRAVNIQERRDRPADAVRGAELALSMATTPEEKAQAQTALQQAQSFQSWWTQAHAPGGDATPKLSVRPSGTPHVNTNETMPGMVQVSAAATAQILSNTEGVDFSSYLQKEVLPKVQRAWSLQMFKTRSNEPPQAGTVIVEFAIARDGTVSGVTMKKSTQQPLLDNTTQSAITTASPFPALPASYHGKALTIRFQCDYKPVASADEAEKK